MHNVEEKYKKILVKIVEKHLPECKIYLFGSRARKTNSPTSDIDLALDCGEAIELSILGKIDEEIEESPVPFTVDLVDLQTVGPEMKKQIEKEKILWSN